MLLFHRSSSFFEAGRHLQEATRKVEGKDIHKLTDQSYFECLRSPWIILFLVRVKHGKQAKWKWVFHAMSKWGR